MAESTVFVGNAEANSVEQMEALLYELFSQCGPVQSIRIPPNDQGKTKGFAFVEMGNISAALYATLAINGMRLNGRCLRLASAMDNEKEKQLRVENLPNNITEIDLYEALSQKVEDIRGICVRRNHSGRSEGKATVWFGSLKAKNEAKEALGKETFYLESMSIRIL
jgi:RNA recognition motif-containing protein